MDAISKEVKDSQNAPGPPLFWGPALAYFISGEEEMEDIREQSSQTQPLSSVSEEIDLNLCESYLVSGMFKEAASLSSSVLKRCLYNPETTASSLKQVIVPYEEEEECGDEYQVLVDIIESAAMVFLQSLKELGRTSEIFSELEAIFGRVDAIPIDVLIMGAHMQIKEGHGTALRPILELFLSAWRFDDGQSYVRLSTKTNTSSLESRVKHPIISKENYLELVDFYVVQLLGTVLHELEFAISWTEKAKMPEDKRHELIRKLQSLCSGKSSCSSHGPHEFVGTNRPASSKGEELQESFKAQCHHDQSNSKWSMLRAIHPYFWLSRSFHLKSGNAPSITQCGKLIFRSSLIILACYILHRKRAALKRFADRQAHSLKKALLDIWQLAFSVQMNPLAAVQPLPSAAIGHR